MAIKSILAGRREGMRNWYFSRRKKLIFGAIIFLVSVLSFGLGYLANRETSSVPIIIEKGP